MDRVERGREPTAAPHPLAEFIRRRRADIIARWEESVRALPVARDLEEPALLDHIPALLDRIAASANDTASAEERASEEDAAEAHVIARLHEGFDLSLVVLEFAALRDAITFLWEAESLAAPVLEELRGLNQAIDRAVSLSIKRYTDARDRTTRALDQLALVALESGNLDELLRNLLGVMLESTPAVDTAAIFLRDGDVMRLRATVGLEDELARGFQVRVGEGIAGTIAKEGKPLAVHAASTDPRLQNEVLVRRGVKALYGVPLFAGGELMGVAKMGSLTAMEFSRQDIALFTTMATRATAAIYQRLLREEAESNARELAAVIDSMPAAVYVADRGGVRRFNKAALELLGHDDDPAALRADLPALAARGDVRDAESGVRLSPNDEPFLRALAGERATRDIAFHDVRSGALRYLHTLAAPIVSGDGQHPREVTGAVSISIDITDRKKLADALRENEQRFRALADNIAQLAWMSEPDGTVTWYNQRWLDFTGTTLETMLATGYRAFHHPQHADRVIAKFLRSLRNGEPWEDTFPLRGKDGVYRWFLSRAVPIRDESGRILRWFGTNTDVTEQRFLSEASRVLSSSLSLDETFDRLAQLAVPALADWCAVDLLVDGALRHVAIAHTDPAKVGLAHELRRRYPSDLNASAGIARVLRTGEPELVHELTDEMLRAGARDATHLELMRALGLQSYVIVPLTARNKTFGTLTVVSAESARRYAQKDVELLAEVGRRAGVAADNARLYEEAQAAVRLRDDVLAVVSHDLKNPLSAIHMTTLSLLRNPGDAARVRSNAERIERSVQRMDRLIADLLDLARVQTGHMKLDVAAHDAADLLRDAVDFQEPIAKERHVALHASDALAPGTRISCDRERVQQVLQNLIGNALKFGRAGDTVTVIAEASERAGWMRFVVRDTGPGIPADELPHIFDPYWSAARHRKRGTGLGLYICKGIVAAHNGTLTVESVEGQGATFAFTLPLAK